MFWFLVGHFLGNGRRRSIDRVRTSGVEVRITTATFASRRTSRGSGVGGWMSACSGRRGPHSLAPRSAAPWGPETVTARFSRRAGALWISMQRHGRHRAASEPIIQAPTTEAPAADTRGAQDERLRGRQRHNAVHPIVVVVMSVLVPAGVRAGQRPVLATPGARQQHQQPAVRWGDARPELQLAWTVGSALCTRGEGVCVSIWPCWCCWLMCATLRHDHGSGGLAAGVAARALSMATVACRAAPSRPSPPGDAGLAARR